MKLSNEELKNVHDNIGELPFIHMNEENIIMLQSIIDELLELRIVVNTPRKSSVQIPKGHVKIDENGDVAESKWYR